MAEEFGHVTDVVEPELALDGVLAELDDKVPERASQSLTLLVGLIGRVERVCGMDSPKLPPSVCERYWGSANNAEAVSRGLDQRN